MFGTGFFNFEMAKKDYNTFAGQKISRIEALSDGVFAIALTLLVLDINVPVKEVINSEANALYALISLHTKFFPYLLGFMTLGIFWAGHAMQFKFIKRTDRHLSWLTVFFLMFVSLMPFSTAFLSEHTQYKVAIGFYWLNIFLLGLMLFLHWSYAYRKNMLDEAIDKAVVNRAVCNRIIYAQIAYAVAALFCFVSTYLSVALIIITQLCFALAFLFKPQVTVEQDDDRE